MIVVGIDPASNGAACIVKNEVAQVVFEWKCRNRKNGRVYVVSISCIGKDEVVAVECKSGADIGSQIGAYVVLLKEDNEEFYLSSEDAYVGTNKNTAIIVAKFAGMIAGSVHNYTRSLNRVLWVQPNKWRFELLKVPYFTKREQVKKYSLDLVPKKIPTISYHINKLGRLDHITDSAGVAMWAWNSITRYNNNGNK
tara:strand:- start:7053 stop:7640 length:588 start_codon:yes stop_codon:yes gene_type:complete